MFKHGFPPEWSTIKKLIWLVGSGIAGASYIWKTVTGTLLHITDAIASPMKKCEVSLEPIQAGSGDPSPTNVRPITGWTGCEVWVKDEYDTSLPATASVTFPDTVYGGSHEFVSGASTVKRAKDSALLSAYSTKYSGDSFDLYVFNDFASGVPVDNPNQICNIAKYQNSSSQTLHFYLSANKKLQIYLPKDIDLTQTVEVCYELAEPTEISLTPQPISTLKGVNNVWSNSNGDTTTIYKAQAE